MKIRYLSVALALAATTLPAVASAEPFDGPYVGVQAGLNHDRIGTVDSDIGPLAAHRSKDAAIGEVIAGYDYKITPKIVIGGEAGFSLGADDAVSRSGNGSDIRIDPRHAFDLSARAGYLVTNDTLIYVRGGYQNVEARTVRAAGNAVVRDTQTFDGWMAGAGIERAITPNITARLEYRYSDLSGGHGKFDRQQGLVGVAYHF